jgi:putative transcriptional regulator
MSKLGKRLIEAEREGRAIARGEADPATYRIHVPADIDVCKIRRQLGLSQDEFAAKFALPVGTVREWEQERRRPEGAARVLLTVIEKDPDALARALTAAVHPGNTAEQSSQDIVRRSKAGGVVRWVDRLGRNYDDVVETIQKFMKRGVIIMTVINGFTFDGSTTDPIQKAVRDSLISFTAATA